MGTCTPTIWLNSISLKSPFFSNTRAEYRGRRGAKGKRSARKSCQSKTRERLGSGGFLQCRNPESLRRLFTAVKGLATLTEFSAGPGRRCQSLRQADDKSRASQVADNRSGGDICLAATLSPDQHVPQCFSGTAVQIDCHRLFAARRHDTIWGGREQTPMTQDKAADCGKWESSPAPDTTESPSPASGSQDSLPARASDLLERP